MGRPQPSRQLFDGGSSPAAATARGLTGFLTRTSKRKKPKIAACDIEAKAAELLLEEPFRQPRVRELLGPRDYTMLEAARILGSAIGKPGMNYAQFSYEDARKGMVDAGLSASYADAIVEISRSFNEGKVHPTERRFEQNTTPTTLEDFAQKIFRKQYEAVESKPT